LKLEREPAIGYPTTKPADEHAVDFIVRSVKAHPNEVTIFALGPPTNLALAIRKNPEIVPLVKRVIYMGGAIDVPGNSTPAAEFNWWFDPEATRISLRAPFREQIVVPLDITERVYYTKSEYDRIVAGPETPITALYRKLHGPRFEKDPSARSFVWDALTAAIFLQPTIATSMVDRFVDVDVTYGPNYGRSIGYHESRRRSLANPAEFPAGTQKMKVLLDIDRQAFWNLYVELMRKPPAGR
jgi:inosine-uridine nucleoside N-ribohydrolase